MISPGHVAAGLSGVAWCNACIAAAGGGKGGGKPNQANASIPCSDEAMLTVILSAGREFAAKW